MDKETLELILDKKLGPLNSNITELNNTVDEAMKTIKFISNQYDEILLKLKAIEEEKKEVILENKSLRAELANAVNELNSQKEAHDILEQYSRRDCLEFRGIPVGDGENTNQTVVKIATKIGVDMNTLDISTSHRLPARTSNKDPPVIIAKFVRRDVRDQVYHARKTLRGITTIDLGLPYKESHPHQ